MYMMKCDNSHSHSHCICNTQNRMLWCCHSLTAAMNSLVSPTATQPHPTVSPYLSQQDSYLVYRRRSSTSPFHLFLLRVNDSRDGPSSHSTRGLTEPSENHAPSCSLQAKTNTFVPPNHLQHPVSHAPTGYILCTTLHLHPPTCSPCALTQTAW